MPRKFLSSLAITGTSTTPVSPVAGQLWYDSTNNQLKVYNGSAWVVAQDGNSFSTVAVSGQSDVVADSGSDTLTLVAGSNITLTTNATNDSVTIASTGGGSSTTSAIVVRDSTVTNATTTLSPVFDSANDALNLDANTRYSFRGRYYFSLVLNTAQTTVMRVGWSFSSTQQSFNCSYVTTSTSTVGVQTAAAAITLGPTQVTPSGSTSRLNHFVDFNGVFVTNATTGGTFTPTFHISAVGTDNSVSIFENSYIEVTKLGTKTTTEISGDWN